MLSDDQFLVDVSVSSKKGPGKVLVIVDGDQGINIDSCADISRKLSKALDESNIMGANYLLEVSTPGVDHPLKLKRQFPKHIGRKLKLKMTDGSSREGRLTLVEDEKLLLEQETGQGKKKETSSIDVPFASIDKAFVLVSFK